MHQKSLALVLLISCFACYEFTAAQQPAPQSTPQPLTIDRIYNGDKFRERSFDPVWSETNGDKYLRYFNSTSMPGEFDIAQLDARKNAAEILVPAKLLVPSGQTRPLKVDDYAFSPDQQWLLIFTNTRKVWRTNTRGDYWVLNRKTEQLRQLGTELPESSLMFAKFSPDNKSVAYVANGDLYLEDLQSGSIKRLTTVASPDIINGTSDWVYEEEFDLKDGFRWSPDSQQVLYWQFDTSDVPTMTLVNNTDSLYPKLTQFKHTKVGQKNSAVRLGVLNLATTETKWIQTEGDPRENYLPRARWLDANEILIQHLNREQNNNKVLIASANDGTVRTLFTDTDNAWLETCDHEFDLDNGKSILWISERDGWRQIFSVDRTTGQQTCLTPGKFDVIELLHVDANRMYFIASPDNPTQRYLYTVPISGGAATRVSPATQPGTHKYNISSDGSLAIHSWSTLVSPPQIELVSLPDHAVLQKFTDNPEVNTELKTLKPIDVGFIKVKTSDGTQLDAWLMKPADFDPAKKYPLIVYVYGEPWGSTVTDSWGGKEFLFHRMLAEQGYAVCSIDNRGANVPRGTQFRKSVYGQIGILAVQDQADAVSALTKHFNWLDAKRVGVWGWSGGGSMTLNAIFKHPEIYHTGIAIAAVPDQTGYDSIYQERYMGLLEKNKINYQQGSPIHFADQLKGNLLIIHGTGDDNCHYQTTERLINELVRHDKPFSMMAYPNRSHSINEGENTTLHLRKLMLRYFKENLSTK